MTDERPHDERETELKARTTVRVPRQFRVVVVEGPNAGAELVLDSQRADRISVGSGETSHFRVEDRLLSRRHLTLEVIEGGLLIVDLGSRNGTRVNGVAIHEAMLEGGETIALGSTKLRVEARVEPAVQETATAKKIRFASTLGRSAAMNKLYPICERLAASDVPVLIEGETGTGKEVLAESLHAEGARAKAPFVVFDCTTISANLLEAELFGQERGAFTGAVQSRKGVFEQAVGGTLFIDEIGDLPLDLQPKLLRAIERREIRRIGGNAWQKLDVRIIAATRRDLDAEVEAGRFRDDLFFRLTVARIELPPLRRREGDVLLLAHHFWSELGGEGELPDALADRLQLYNWPGNVRELHNEIARIVALGSLSESMPGRISRYTESAGKGDEATWRLPFPDARKWALERFEKRYVELLLARHKEPGQAARAAGISLRYLQMIRARTE